MTRKPRTTGMRRFVTALAMLAWIPTAWGVEDTSRTPPITTPSELQSQLMVFADRLVARLAGATNDYLYLKGYSRDPRVRFAITSRRLAAAEAAASIAAGPDPEVSLLDMVVLVSLLKLSMRDVWIPKKYTPDGKIVLDALDESERDIWSIAKQVLSPNQAMELREMINAWHKKNLDKLVAVTGIRFKDFARDRHKSSLISKGKPGGFLKEVAKANKEIERTRILADRMAYLLEREPTLIRWQVEQIFYDLAIEPEFATALSAATDIGQVGKHFSRTLDKLPTLIAAERKAALDQAFNKLSKERNDTIRQAVSEISRERQALIDQTSDRILDKAFYLGLSLIIVLLTGAIAARLVYRYLELRLFSGPESNPGQRNRM